MKRALLIAAVLLAATAAACHFGARQPDSWRHPAPRDAGVDGAR